MRKLDKENDISISEYWKVTYAQGSHTITLEKAHKNAILIVSAYDNTGGGSVKYSSTTCENLGELGYISPENISGNVKCAIWVAALKNSKIGDTVTFSELIWKCSISVIDV